jgi:hypothetical protein
VCFFFFMISLCFGRSYSELNVCVCVCVCACVCVWVGGYDGPRV